MILFIAGIPLLITIIGIPMMIIAWIWALLTRIEAVKDPEIA